MQLVSERAKGARPQRASLIGAAALILLIAGAAVLMLSGDGGACGGGGWRWQRAGLCPACPSCPGGRDSTAAGLRQQRGEHLDPALVCGGPAQVPAVDASVAAATAAMLAGPEQDLERWRDGFTRGDIEATMRRLGVNGNNDLHLLVEIKGNRVHFPLRRSKDRCFENCNYLAQSIADGINRGLELGRLQLKEGIPMIWNMHDWGICWDVENKQLGDRVGCPSPVFSPIRRDGEHYDVLMPNFREPLWPQYVPWDSKKEVAFFRGTPFCHTHPLNGDGTPATCSRLLLPNITAQHPDLINITINVEALGTPATPMGHVSYLEQAHYKYLVDLVGISASNRLAAQLGINSAVLKQASREVEWYYRAIHPCVHYLPFWVDNTTDILQLVQRLKSDPANDEAARRVAANGQAFALAHLTEEARWRYWQALFDRYAALYKGGEPGDPPSRNYTVLPNGCYGCTPPDLPPEAEAAVAEAQQRRQRS
ncbi:hypothetical protein ABPG75_011889 [Micractinium tetrahymenae]